MTDVSTGIHRYGTPGMPPHTGKIVRTASSFEPNGYKAGSYLIFFLYSRKLLLTTEILLKAMARAARMGCS